MKTWWNFHHLALFYHVALHRGISAALPHIGYSLQQPALSEQMLELEGAIGHKLFIRQPFPLTPAGARVFAELGPGFERLLCTLGELQKLPGECLRVGAPDLAVSRFLPPLTAALQREFSTLCFSLTADDDDGLLRRLAAGKLDLVIATERPARLGNLCCRTLLRLPLALLLPNNPPTADVRTLLARRPRLCAVDEGPVWRRFTAGLKARGLEWKPNVTVSCFDAVPFWVASGHGVGLGVSLPALTEPLPLARVPLPGFEPIEVVLIHGRNPEAPVKRLAEAIASRAADL